MKPGPTARLLVTAALSAGGLLCWQLLGRGVAGPERQDGRPPLPAGLPVPETLAPAFAGTNNCKSCHSDGRTRGTPPLCTCKEFLTWENRDKHAAAYTSLESPRAQAMETALGWEKGRATTDRRCLSCHAVVMPDKAVEELSKTLEYKISDGVNCVVCHGGYEPWITLHGGPRYQAWRKLTREQKEFYFGLTDLRNPRTRAALCASCHIGDPASNKLVTHDMYAAGHPPLPSIEVGLFGEEMPRHWQLLRDKPAETLRDLRLPADAADGERSRMVLTGGVVSFRTAIRVLRDEAASLAAAPPDRQRLDLAQFDCYACHHDLRYPGWRQTRGYVGAPGRPQPRPWPTALIRVALRQLEETEPDLDERLRELALAFDDRPFGNPARIVTATTKVIDWLDAKGTVEGRLNSVRWNRPAVRALVDHLTAVAGEGFHDYDSARQLAWALRMVAGDLRPGKSFADLRPVTEPLNDLLTLDLPSGQDRQVLNPANLKKRAEYDPTTFRDLFIGIARLVKNSDAGD